MWSQIVGKVMLGARGVAIEFDFLDHVLRLTRPVEVEVAIPFPDDDAPRRRRRGRVLRVRVPRAGRLRRASRRTGGRVV
jgi:hypothetical protein